MQNGHNMGTEPCGVIVMDKHEGVSSFRMIQILRKMFDTKKVGHTGTLDPLATGVLPVLVGRAVKASEYIMSTMDATGTISGDSINVRIWLRRGIL